ncbi:unnamed protein product, partial [Prorocentrum cordatum]
VLSRNAVTAWGEGMQRCLDFFREECSGSCFWGEDMFMDQCFIKVLELPREDLFNMLVEEHCDPPDNWEKCEDPAYVCYHPFKTKNGYKECHDMAAEAVAEST